MANRRIGGFSLGMRQRLGLAGALIANPEILILDEPANGLDPEGVRWLRDLLRGYAADGGTVLGSSHILAEVAQTVDHVVIIDHGQAGPSGLAGRGGRKQRSGNYLLQPHRREPTVTGMILAGLAAPRTMRAAGGRFHAAFGGL